MTKPKNDKPQEAEGAAPKKKGFFASKLLWIALVFTVLAAGWTIAQRLDRSKPAPADASGVVRSLTDAAAAPAPRDPTLAERAAPAAARSGLSFVMGYAVGWFLRRALKIAAIIALLAVLALYVLKRTGVLADPAALHDSVEAAGEWAKREGAAFKDFALGLAPSAMAGGAGLIVGALRR